MGKSYDFRIRFILAPGEQLNIDSTDIDLSGDYHPDLVLSTGNPEKTIIQSKHLVLRGIDHLSEEEAYTKGEQVRDLLSRTLSKLHIGADFGDRTPKSGFFRPGLAMLEQESERKVLNDVHGLMTFENSPNLAFARLGDVRVIRGSNEDRFLKVFRLSCEILETLTDKERLSYDLFSASYFERSQDARLLTLVMSYEVLLEPLKRPIHVLQHVEDLIAQTKSSNSLPAEHRSSLLGSLSWLRNESISQAGRRFARERLGDQEYLEMTAEKFFTYCYGIRSRLIHGQEPIPTRNEVSLAAATLEGFVADILSGSLLESPI